MNYSTPPTAHTVHGRFFAVMRAAILLVIGSTLLSIPFSANAALGPNLIVNGDLGTIASNGLPKGWAKGGFGTNTRTLTYPVPGYNSAKGVRTEITNYTSGDAKWYFTHVPAQAGQLYTFSNAYRSNTQSYVTVEFKLSDGRSTYLDIGALASTNDWKNFRMNFTAPPEAVSMTVFHLIKSVGFLESDAYYLGTNDDPTKFDKGYVSIMFDDGVKLAHDNAFPILDDAGFKATTFIITERLADDNFPGYLKADEVLALQSAGHEIGAHTRTHPDLTKLSTEAARAEIKGSRDDLLDIGATPVNFFAYPFGAYNNTTKQIVKDSGFLGGRSSDGGYNFKTQDPYALRRQSMENTTTFAQIKNHIDTALAQRSWVILLFHHVDQSGTRYAVTPELFAQTVEYLEQKNVTPITVSQGVRMLNR